MFVGIDKDVGRLGHREGIFESGQAAKHGMKRSSFAPSDRHLISIVLHRECYCNWEALIPVIIQLQG